MNKNYGKYIRSKAWRRKANERLEMDGHTCQVCGRKAEEVHHLTYDRFGHEDMNDLVSLCRKCHRKAEDLYDPSAIPWAMEHENNFMAAVRVDADRVAPVVFEYLKEISGGFDGLMRLRQPVDEEGKKYWSRLKVAIDALCRKRYWRNCVEDRTDIMLGAIENRVMTIALQQIEHDTRNSVQAELNSIVMTDYAIFGKWKAVAEELGIKNGTLQTLRRDDGTSFGPSVREAALYYCGLDAAAGIQPVSGLSCFTAEDYAHLSALADHMRSVSVEESKRGEHA